jgi:dephospho-CoA kinase
MRPQKTVIGVAGMPGAGKSLVGDVARELGYEVVVMGDIIREEAKSLGLEPTPENLGKIMLKLRESEGPEVVAKRCIPRIEASPSQVVLVDGLRSLDEVFEFRRKFRDFKVLGIHASPETRFQRLFGRKRSDDPKGWTEFNERDQRELRVGVGSVIALADYIIVNEEAVSKFRAKVMRFFKLRCIH